MQPGMLETVLTALLYYKKIALPVSNMFDKFHCHSCNDDFYAKEAIVRHYFRNHATVLTDPALPNFKFYELTHPPEGRYNTTLLFEDPMDPKHGSLRTAYCGHCTARRFNNLSAFIAHKKKCNLVFRENEALRNKPSAAPVVYYNSKKRAHPEPPSSSEATAESASSITTTEVLLLPRLSTEKMDVEWIKICLPGQNPLIIRDHDMIITGITKDQHHISPDRQMKLLYWRNIEELILPVSKTQKFVVPMLQISI